MMKKILAFSLVVCIVLAISASCMAESRLAEFENLLTGTWVSYNNLGSRGNQPKVDIFTYPSKGSGQLSSSLEGLKNTEYEIYLTEAGNGDIYLTINSDTITSIGKISFSSDGKVLIVLSVLDNDIIGIYKKE